MPSVTGALESIASGPFAMTLAERGVTSERIAPPAAPTVIVAVSVPAPASVSVLPVGWRCVSCAGR
jgi:hypothetical protein